MVETVEFSEDGFCFTVSGVLRTDPLKCHASLDLRVELTSRGVNGNGSDFRELVKCEESIADGKPVNLVFELLQRQLIVLDSLLDPVDSRRVSLQFLTPTDEPVQVPRRDAQ